jgi:short-subunit dehydrogenase
MKRAFVTGGTRGIGFHLCKMLLRNRYEVVFTGRTQENVNNALQLFNDDNIQGVVLDMTKPNNMPNFSMNFDTVIHNAGMLSRDNLINMNESRLEKMFMVNTMGPICLTKQYLPYMIKQNHGNIFFFCPPYRIDNKTRKLTPYMQTKLGQTTFMYSLADMLSRSYRGVTVSGFWTDYPIYTDALIHRRIGTKDNCMSPEIIAKTVELMLHDKKENIHGNVMIDRYYLLEKECNPRNWALGNHTKRLDDLFLSNQEN